MGTDQDTEPQAAPELPVAPGLAVRIERRGRWWVFGSFLLCPCHLPLTLGVLAAVLGGTSMGAALRDNLVFAALVVSMVWMLGTAYGFRLLQRAKALGGACPTRATRRGPAEVG